jgi:DNA helicase HerA-like ATPase
MQNSFVNQLAMLLFTWIKKNPHPPGGRTLRGLLVIDEAKDVVPSRKTTECKESLMRLAAQARKYGLGLVFATQHPRDIETKIVGNCATHLYGLNNSPASIETLKDLMAQKGGTGNDIGRLKQGQFYIHNADIGQRAPIKIQVPMSLSVSPGNPLDELAILDKARRSKQAIQR